MCYVPYANCKSCFLRLVFISYVRLLHAAKYAYRLLAFLSQCVSLFCNVNNVLVLCTTGVIKYTHCSMIKTYYPLPLH